MICFKGFFIVRTWIRIYDTKRVVVGGQVNKKKGNYKWPGWCNIFILVESGSSRRGGFIINTGRHKT